MFGKKSDKPIPLVEERQVNLTQASAHHIHADEVSLQQSFAQSVTADNVNLDQAAAGLVRSARASITNGAAGVLVGDRISAENASAIFFVARNINGNVKTVFDQKSALALGAGAIIVWSLIKVLGIFSGSKDPI